MNKIVIEVIFILVCLTGPLIIHCQSISDESGCGKTQGCFTCTDNKDGCKAEKKYTLAYKKNGSSVEFEMSAKNQWVALGFNSKGDSMIGTDTVMCATISGNVELQHYDLTSKLLPPKTNPLPSQLTLISGTYKDGKTTCRFQRKIDASGSSLKSLYTPHFLVFAYGPVVGSDPHYHKWRITAEKAVDVQLVNESSVIPPTQNTSNELEDGCGKTIGCFTCTDRTDNCKAEKKYVLTYKKPKNADFVEFEMSGKNQWVALGFNAKGDLMIGTDTVMCSTISGNVELQHYDLSSKSLPSKTNPLPSELTLINGTYKDGKTTCRFQRKIDASGSSLKSLDTPHFLVFAYGPVDGSNPRHHKWKVTTTIAVDVRVAASLVGRSSIPALIKAHGSLMILAWMCFAAISIFMARYMRLVWEDEKLLGQKVWFTVHRGLMVFVIIFSTIGIILAFVNGKGWSEDIGAHPYTGIITFALALIQPIMAFFRPHPGEERRFIFNWAHRTVGLSALILGVVTLFLAVYIKFLHLEKSGLPIMIIFCVGVVIVLIFEIFFCFQASNDQSFSTTTDTSGKMEQMEEIQSKPSLSSTGRCVRLGLFGFVVLLAIATSLAFVIVIAMK